MSNKPTTMKPSSTAEANEILDKTASILRGVKSVQRYKEVTAMTGRPKFEEEVLKVLEKSEAVKKLEKELTKAIRRNSRITGVKTHVSGILIRDIMEALSSDLDNLRVVINELSQ